MKNFKRGLGLLLCAAVCLLVQAAGQAEEMPAFDSFFDLQVYLQSCIRARRQSVEFVLKDKAALDMSNDALGQEMVQMSAQLVQCRANMNRQDEEQIVIKMEMVYRPGIRIADAWEKGDTRGLSEEERTTLCRAEKIVEEARRTAKDELSMEKALHDWLCRTVSYQDMIREGYVGKQQRVLSAVGALMDGVANCQGYSDAFYLLGTIAGLEVDFQCGYDGDHRTHIWNTICLDGAWYVLDVTADDPMSKEFPLGIPNYLAFNLGRDFCGNAFSWPAHWQVRDVARQSDKQYYLSEDAPGYGRRFADLERMAEYVYKQRVNEGQDILYALFVGTPPSEDEVNNAIKRTLERHQRAASWRFWHWDRGERTYYIVQWTEF